MKKTYKLENGTVLEVGKKYRVHTWSEDDYMLVLFLGKNHFFARHIDGMECTFSYESKWLPYEEPKEETILYEVACEYNEGHTKLMRFLSGEKEIAKELENISGIKAIHKLRAFKKVNGKLVKVELKEE